MEYLNSFSKPMDSKETTTVILLVLMSLNVLIFLDVNNLNLNIKQHPQLGRLQPLYRNATTTTDCIEKVRKLYYLKTHKTGSTTISNILFRLAMSTNSTIAVFTKHAEGLISSKHRDLTLGPVLGPSYYVIPHPDDMDASGLVPSSKKRSKFDIQLEHTHFNEKDVFKIMSWNTKFIATVRHPLNHLKSVFNHYHMWRVLGMDPEDEDNAIQLFLHNPYKYESNSKIFRVRNKMVYEFGINMNRLEDEHYVADYLQYLQQRFDHVLITEHLDESLMLLKRSMCWEMKDIIYLAQRNATYFGKQAQPQDYGELLQTHKKWTWIDYSLYYQFLKLHQEKVKALGRDFQEEVDTYKLILQLVHRYCNEFQDKVWDKERYSNESIVRLSQENLTVRKTRFNKEFFITGTECLKMRFSHTTMRYIAVSKQYPKSCSTYNESYPIKGNPMYCKSNNSDNRFLEESIPLFVARRRHGYLA